MNNSELSFKIRELLKIIDEEGLKFEDCNWDRVDACYAELFGLGIDGFRHVVDFLRCHSVTYDRSGYPETGCTRKLNADMKAYYLSGNSETLADQLFGGDKNVV